MKKKNIFLCALLGVVAMFNVACGDDDDIKPTDVPEAVMTAFQDMYPGAVAEWEKVAGGLLKAEFLYDAHEKDAWFEQNGTWVKTITEIATSELPQAIRDYISTTYPTGQIEDSDFVETLTENTYVVEVDRENESDLYLNFTESGELVTP
ncbi:MAG: PepSY-like domain-containing protein [Bacteroidaceae bacterium]|nr:PepSY-like domain-containing protein [Bacteroidaceae bacterium]